MHIIHVRVRTNPVRLKIKRVFIHLLQPLGRLIKFLSSGGFALRGQSEAGGKRSGLFRCGSLWLPPHALNRKVDNRLRRVRPHIPVLAPFRDIHNAFRRKRVQDVIAGRAVDARFSRYLGYSSVSQLQRAIDGCAFS